MRQIRKITVICEGAEEKEYLERLKSIGVFSSNYKFSFKNVNGITNIFPNYQEIYTMDMEDIVLIFCDTDKYPYKNYTKLKDQLIRYYGKKEIINDLVIFGNPNTMQIILLHFENIRLKSQSKNINYKEIERLLKIKGYKANKSQRKELFSKINKTNIKVLFKNLNTISDKDNIIGSTNFKKFLLLFKSKNTKWIDRINSKLESE